jgi:small subunit ribosomal protein S10
MLNPVRFGLFSNQNVKALVYQPYSLFNTSEVASNTAVDKEAQDELDSLFEKVVVEVRGHDDSVLRSYETFVKYAAQRLQIKMAGTRKPERFIERWTILKSVFVHKKHFRQYEMRTYFREFEFRHLTGSTCDTLLEYIQRNIPEGVSMYVHRTEIRPLDENLKPPANDS